MGSRARLRDPDAPAQRRWLVSELLGVRVWDFRCRAHVHPEGAEEANEEHSVVFVRRGAFGRTRRREARLADANHVLFFNAGEPYRISHPVPGGDECTIVSLPSDLVRELVARHAPRDTESEHLPFRAPQALSTPRAARLHWELFPLLCGEPGLAAEDAMAELLREAVRAAYAPDGDAPPDDAPAARRRHREAVEEVKGRLNAELERPPRLAELAAAVGMSPFHLSRTFRRTCGLPLRRYAARLRARSAAPRLARGEDDLTALALELGYADHSHLTNAFRAEWGMPPSAFRDRVRRASGVASGSAL